MFYTFAVEVCWGIYGLEMTFNYHVFWKNHYSNSFSADLYFWKIMWILDLDLHGIENIRQYPNVNIIIPEMLWAQ